MRCVMASAAFDPQLPCTLCDNSMRQTSQHPNVFVVDDEEIIASTLAEILNMQGKFHAKSFTEPLEALSAARLEAPDLLITDVAMPLLSGIELAIQVREFCPDCRILLFSGQASAAHMLRDAQADEYGFELISKPVPPSDLLGKSPNSDRDRSAVRYAIASNPSSIFDTRYVLGLIRPIQKSE